MGEAKVIRGVKKTVKAKQKEPFAYVDTKGLDLTEMKRKVVWNKKIQAPIRKGQVLGMSVYYLNGEKVGNVEIVAAEAVGEITYRRLQKKLPEAFCCRAKSKSERERYLQIRENNYIMIQDIKRRRIIEDRNENGRDSRGGSRPGSIPDDRNYSGDAYLSCSTLLY